MNKTGKYILVITAHRKNARRHIVDRCDDIRNLRIFGFNNINPCYKVEIYNSKWELLEVVRG